MKKQMLFANFVLASFVFSFLIEPNFAAFIPSARAEYDPSHRAVIVSVFGKQMFPEQSVLKSVFTDIMGFYFSKLFFAKTITLAAGIEGGGTVCVQFANTFTPAVVKNFIDSLNKVPFDPERTQYEVSSQKECPNSP